MALFYPHKQTSLIALVCLIVVGAAAYSAYGSSLTSKNTAPTVSVGENTSGDAQGIIATNDDWRKAFLNAPSTTASASSGKGKTTAGDIATTSTDLLGRDFFAHYIALKQANLLDNQDIVDQTTDDVVTRNFDSIQPKSYTLADLNITSSSDAATLSSFANGVAQAIGSYSATEGEGAILQKYFDTTDPNVLKALDPAISSYKRMLSMLLSLRTPRIAANDELDLVNAVSSLEFAAESLRIADADNIRGLAGASLHVQGINLMISALGNINQDLDSYGVALKLDQSVFNAMLN